MGFRTLGQWLPDVGLRLDVNVWYPTTRQPQECNYAPWEFSAARGGKVAEGRFPLLLLSHDTAGTRFSYHDTAAALVRHGFVVAAPCHPRDHMDNMDDLLTLEQLEHRVQELAGTVDLLLATPELKASLDPDRVGVIGFGAGGTAALLLGGALPDCASWPPYCSQAEPADMYCQAWAHKRMDTLCTRLPLPQSPADVRIKAVAAVDPAFGMLFSRSSFRWFYPPLLLAEAGADTLHPSRLHAHHIFTLLDKKPHWLSLPDADTGALMAPCPASLDQELPELCRSVTPEQRERLHHEMETALQQFFLHYLGKGSKKNRIPSPPNLTPTPLPPLPETSTTTPRPRHQGKR